MTRRRLLIEPCTESTESTGPLVHNALYLMRIYHKPLDPFENVNFSRAGSWKLKLRYLMKTSSSKMNTTKDWKTNAIGLQLIQKPPKVDLKKQLRDYNTDMSDTSRFDPSDLEELHRQFTIQSV